jgi:hypothetical protein
LLLGPEGIGEIVVECRVLCIEFLGSEKKLQARALIAVQSASRIKGAMSST